MCMLLSYGRLATDVDGRYETDECCFYNHFAYHYNTRSLTISTLENTIQIEVSLEQEILYQYFTYRMIPKHIAYIILDVEVSDTQDTV